MQIAIYSLELYASNYTALGTRTLPDLSFYFLQSFTMYIIVAMTPSLDHPAHCWQSTLGRCHYTLQQSPATPQTRFAQASHP